VIAAAVAAAASFACHPEPGLGTVTLERRGALHAIDLATCRDSIRHGRLPAALVRDVEVRTSKDWWTLVVSENGRRREIYRVTRHYRVVSEDKGPIEVLGRSGDGRWIFFVIDPDSSGSLQADGLMLRAISVRGGRVFKLARMLVYRDYLAWCGGRLVFTAGIDRVATNRKRLLVAAPPLWRPRPLVATPNRSWGSLACAPAGRSLVAQSQLSSGNASFFATRWALWRVGLNGSTRRLTSPPAGFADESPRFSRDGKVALFVRMHKGNGYLYALRGTRATGPLLFLGNSIGYYGHHDWWQTAAWSLAR
jgi:WD40-like Beta Propeller Repeat